MDTSEPDNTRAHNQTTAARALFIMRVGAQLFAVSADEVEATATHLTPTPLPFAPPAVRGVVSLRGRVRTVLDPARLFDANRSGSQASNQLSESQASVQTAARLFVALSGDEQLALVCDDAEETLEVAPALIKPRGDASLTRGTFEHRGRTVTLLDPARLFDAAMRGTERRRRRS